jgi:RNA polymerase sigma-70 factor (ECF subfamily)
VEEAVRDAQRGRTAAFELLVEHYGPPMYRIACGIVGPDDGRDAAQEAFVLAWRQLPTLRDVTRFEAWLRRILVNQCRKTLRTRHRRPAMSLDRSLDGGVEPAMAVDFRDAVHSRQSLDRAWDVLNADQRAVVVLHYGVGLSIREAADATHVAVGTAKSRLSSALARLRQAVEAQG